MGSGAPATRATVVTIGNELLSGEVIDTNSATIAQRLLSIGIPVEQMVTVGDDKARIEEMVKGLVGCIGLAIVTGGLGPTEDDITAETAATALERELVLDKGSLDHIKEIFDKEIAVNVHVIPLPMLSYYKSLGYNIADYPVTLDNYSREISLPVYYNLTDEQIDSVIKAGVESVEKVMG